MHDDFLYYEGNVFHPLKESEVRRLSKVVDRESLEAFLRDYQARILIPYELPAITRAFRHACRNETRELIAFDNEIASVPELKPSLPASRRVGNVQIKRLRPLQTSRITQRYLNAVESGLANGWHTTVYGLTLSVYSLPILEGLVSYERQTLCGFVHAVARNLRISEIECGSIINDLKPLFPSKREDVLGEDEPVRVAAHVS